ncbi:MAG: right-handed parallel beta-helix repeat-containing protein, partial [Bacteroidota bacterium]
MKKITAILIWIFIVHVAIYGQKTSLECTIEIASDVVLIDGSTYSPGDVVCLLAGDKDYLLLRDFQGTAAEPITIINKGGAVVIDTDHFYGIKFDNCKHVIFSGNGEEDLQYGIQVTRVGNGAGMSVDNMSTNVEIEYVEISYTLIAGIYAKTEPYQGDCDNLITREVFTMYDLKIHDCYLHDIADEGFYIGSSKYTGQTISQCNNIVVLPHVIEGVQVYDNIVERTGWDGIQVSSATTDCNIFNNLVSFDSFDEEYGQMSGILIGGGSKCDCYNNKILDGKGDGIDVFGLGFMKIYNNLIVRAGATYKPDEPNEYKHGIYVGQVVTTPNSTFKLYNNTIVSPKTSGIKYANDDAEMAYIKNNLITDPGELDNNPSYIIIAVDEQKVEMSNNFNVLTNSQAKFLDFADDNFDLKPDSEAVNYGTSLTNEGITFDIEDRFRPFHTYFDAGAYECHDPSAAINENGANVGLAYPVPAK